MLAHRWLCRSGRLPVVSDYRERLDECQRAIAIAVIRFVSHSQRCGAGPSFGNGDTLWLDAVQSNRLESHCSSALKCGNGANHRARTLGEQPSRCSIGWGCIRPTSGGDSRDPEGGGYWWTDIFGDVFPIGDAGWFGSMTSQPLNAQITHIVATPDGKGYWLVAGDGGIFAFGDAGFFGSMGGQHLNAPVVDLAPAPSGRGYWLVAADGGVFAFGDAVFRGSMAGAPLNKPIVGIGADNATGGYWEVASDGGVFAIGAPFLGSTGQLSLVSPVNGMAVTSDSHGYWFVASDGGVFAFGDAAFQGSLAGQPLNAPVVGMAADFATGGYRLLRSDGTVFGFNALTGRALPVTVTSVTATTTPYDPTHASAGYPAEQVNFTVGGSPTGSLTCQIVILYNGTVVGSATYGRGLPAGSPSSLQESATVDVSGDNFDGNPSNAHVTCSTP